MSVAKRFGGKYSPDGNSDLDTPEGKRARRIEVDPVGGRANVLFVPAIVLVATSFSEGAISLLAALLGALSLTLAAWLVRGGLRAEAEFNARKVARRPALPRKILAAGFAGVGTALAVVAHLDNFTVISPIINIDTIHGLLAKDKAGDLNIGGIC